MGPGEQDYESYREYLTSEQMPRALRTAFYCAVGAIVAFVPLDFIVFNADWVSFLIVRGLAAATTIALYVTLRTGSPDKQANCAG